MNIISRFAEVFRRKPQVWQAPPMDPKIRELRTVYDTKRKRHENTKPILDKLRAYQAKRLRGDTK